MSRASWTARLAGIDRIADGRVGTLIVWPLFIMVERPDDAARWGIVWVPRFGR
jgi:hypothetical protein